MAKYCLAVAAKSFDKPSETFVRRHAYELCPDRTVLLSYAADPPNGKKAPVLTEFDKKYEKPFRFYSLFRVAGFLKRYRVKHLLAEYGPVGVDIARGAQSAGCSLFVHFHGYDASKALRKPSKVRDYQALFELADGFFAPSRFLAQKLIDIGCPEDKITVCACGVDPANFSVVAGDPHRFLSVGRFVEKKAPLTTLEAFAEGTAGFPDAHLDYVGDGELFEDAQAFVAQNGLEDRITLHGAKPHQFVMDLMQRSSIYLQHSVEDSSGDCEGLPVAILEAMSSGLVVVSTRHSGIPEAVIDGDSGLLVDEHDGAGMAKAINRVLSDSDLAARLATNAAARARTHFTAEQSLQIIREAMGLPSDCRSP